MQPDGNLVVYSAARQPIFATNTSSGPGSYLLVQSDGNLALYSAANVAVWATNT